MSFLDRIRGKPRDTQEERVDAKPGETGMSAADDVSDANQSPEQVETSAETRRDEEAIRHQGI